MPPHPHSSAARLIAAGALALCAACGGDDPPETAGGAWRSGSEWRLVKEAQIGSADAEGPAAFSDIVAVLVDGLDRVWVADGQQQEVRVFDARGGHVRTIGRKGGGPEEFGRIAGMDWGAGGNLWVVDGGNDRFAVWDTAGRLVATHRRASNTLTIPWPGSFDAQGRLYDMGASGVDGGGGTVVRSGPDLQPQDTFAIPPFEGEFWELTTRGRTGVTINMRLGVPFTGTQAWRVDPRGNLWIARTQQYRLERHAFGGTPGLVVERPAPPVRIPDEERARTLARFDRLKQEGGKIDESRIPDTYPALLSFFFADDAHLWVFPMLGPDHSVADVFDPAGRFLGRMTLPARVRPVPTPAVRGNRFVGVVRDADEVETVWVMRIEKP